MPKNSKTGLENPPVSQLFDMLVEAYSKSAETIADELARTAATPNGEDSDPSRETIMSYVKTPKSVIVGKRSVQRKNKSTPVHYKFAHLVINYLDGRRPDDGHIEVPKSLENGNPWRQARKLCKEVLARERNRRFELPLSSDPGMQTAIRSVRGVYATCRRESSDAQYHQELLLLSDDGAENASRCHCTYVTEKGVTRGEWVLVGNVLHCQLGGLRGDNTRDIGGLYLYAGERDLMTGFLAGTGTQLRLPVAMPVVAVRVPSPSTSVVRLGDLGDEAILRAFRHVKPDLSQISKQLLAILPDRSETVHNVVDVQAKLRSTFNGGRDLIADSLIEFCKKTFA